MTNTTAAILKSLDEQSRADLKSQHYALDCLRGFLDEFRASLRGAPENIKPRIDVLKNVNCLIGLLACADGRHSVRKELREDALAGEFAPSAQDLVEEERLELVAALEEPSKALTGGDRYLFREDSPEAACARFHLNSAVRALESFDALQKRDEEEDDLDDDCDLPIPYTVVDHGGPDTIPVPPPPVKWGVFFRMNGERVRSTDVRGEFDSYRAAYKAIEAFEKVRGTLSGCGASRYPAII